MYKAKTFTAKQFQLAVYQSGAPELIPN